MKNFDLNYLFNYNFDNIVVSLNAGKYFSEIKIDKFFKREFIYKELKELKKIEKRYLNFFNISFNDIYRINNFTIDYMIDDNNKFVVTNYVYKYNYNNISIYSELNPKTNYKRISIIKCDKDYKTRELYKANEFFLIHEAIKITENLIFL